MSRRLIIAVALLLAELTFFAPPASAAGSVSVSAWNCTESVDPETDVADAFAERCVIEVANSTFALTAGGVTRRRATALDKPASWPAVSGEFSIEIDNPFGLESAVFCQREDAPAERIEVIDGRIKDDIGDSTSFGCRWYLFAAAAQPTATPTPSPTTTPDAQPTATPRSTSPTAIPTATPRATATESGGPGAPTATPAQSTTEPEVIYPPAMFRGNPARTGEQTGPGPEGDPLLLWRYPVAQRPVSSPVKSGDTIYIGGDFGLFAIDARTGTQRWLFPTERTVDSTPAIVDGLVYFGAKDGFLYCLDAQTGIERWRFETGAMIISSPLVDAGRAYISSYDGYLYAVDAASGTEQWRFLIEGIEFLSSPAIDNGIVYVGSGDIDGGILYGIDAETGVELLRRQVAGAIASTPAIADGVLYFGSDDGVEYALNLETLAFNWRIGAGRLIRSSTGVSDGRFFFGGRAGDFNAHDALTGEELWTFDTDDWIDSSGSFANGKVYLGTKNLRLFVFDVKDGTVLWEYYIGSYITTSPLVEDSVVYVAARDGFLYAIGGAESSPDAIGRAENAARPADVPLEVVVDGERLLFDRMIEIDPALLSFASSTGKLFYYTHDSDREFGAIYADRPVHELDQEANEREFARYLPAFNGIEGASCTAQAPRNALIISDGQSSFAFAGAEPDFPIDLLNSVASSTQLGTVYAEGPAPPFRQLYIVDGTELQRYVLTDGDGLPENLQEPFPFNGQIFSFSGDVSDRTTESALTQVGCSGPFPVYAEGSDGEFAQLIIAIGDKLLQFDEVPLREPAE